MAPFDVTLLQNTALDDAATNDTTSTVGEPSLAWSNRDVYVTGNWFASRSTDDGATWTHVDLFTTLPPAAHDSLPCCDNVVLHDAARGIWIWVLQYVQANNTNVFRLAVSRDADFSAGGWYWWDVTPGGLDGGWSQLWFDYPDAALTDENLFVTFNVFNTSDQWQRAVVMRFPLDTLASADPLGFTWWSTTENGSLRLTQGAGSTMYWADNLTTSTLRLFSWPDGQNSISWWDLDVTSWSPAIASTAPNGADWLARCDSRITAGAVGAGVITFAWTAGAQNARPHAYCRVVRIDEAAKTVTDQPDLWSSTRAWAYPAAATNRDGVVGFTAFYGGNDRNPGHVVGARDDSAGAWRSKYTRLGSDSPGDGKWGDYLTCRQHDPESDTWVASGYTLEGGQARTDIVPRVVRFALQTV